MSIKNIDYVAAPPPAHFVGDGFRVHNFIPGGVKLDMKSMDPFIMLDYNSRYTFAPSKNPKGVGVHPHKGFETVTIAYKGRIEHGDSSGGGGIIAEGDVQWMTAASGILHKEFHEKEWSKTGGDFQMVQLWVNLPAIYKKSIPKYQALKNKDINRFYFENGQGEVEVIAGEYNGIKGSATTFSPVHLFNVKAKAGTVSSFSFPSTYSTVALVIEGEIMINDLEKVTTDHLALMKKDGETFTIEVISDAIILVLSGEPINEPIVHQGPFVMNTREELSEAFKEFNEGKFGMLK